ncbi:unnamed protein product [Linum trigynum]|uniref:Uncharacterized protein n=1 Tax=Linum trigynum TaxID=586398 RepID=A0AAV2DB10_9ROSI
MDEEIFHELCIEFYSTFSHIIPASKKSRFRVEFMQGGQPQVVTYDGFAQAMGLDTAHMTMMERQYTVDFDYQDAFRALCCPEHEQSEFEGSKTKAIKLKTLWRILHTLLTKFVVPSLQSGHLMTNRGLIALHSMRSPAEPIHLESLIDAYGRHHHKDSPILPGGSGPLHQRRKDGAFHSGDIVQSEAGTPGRERSGVPQWTPTLPRPFAPLLYL